VACGGAVGEGDRLGGAHLSIIIINE
jgi:hypothetical protein